MTESTETTDRTYTGDEMRALLVAGAKYSGYLGKQAAVHLLTFTDLPDWRGFRALVDVELGVHDRVRDETYDAAFVRWGGLIDQTRPAHISGGGRRLLDLAVSMASGAPVDLRDALAGAGHAHARRIIEAVAIATGGDEFYTVTPTPALDAVLDFHREIQQETVRKTTPAERAAPCEVSADDSGRQCGKAPAGLAVKLGDRLPVCRGHVPVIVDAGYVFEENPK